MGNLFKTIMATCVLGSGMLASAAPQSEVAPPEIYVTADVASAYVFRGVTYNDGLVVQPALEASGFGLPKSIGTLTAGMWANYNIDDYRDAMADTVNEVDLYALYALPLDPLIISLGYIRYAYPNQTDGAVARQDESEGVLKLAYDLDGLFFGANLYYGIDGAIKKNFYYDLSAEYALELSKEFSLNIGALVGYAQPESGNEGWNEAVADVGIAYTFSRYWKFNGSIAYIYQIDDEVLADVSAADYGYDADLVYKLGVSCRF